MRIRGQAEPSTVAGIGRDFRFDEDDVEHEGKDEGGRMKEEEKCCRVQWTSYFRKNKLAAAP
jgi:hypothetical protein